MVLDSTIEEFKKLTKKFYEEHKHLSSLKEDKEKITLVLKEKYFRMDNGRYTLPKISSYKLAGNFMTFVVGVNSNGSERTRKIQFGKGTGHQRIFTFSKTEKSVHNISMADYVLLSPKVEGSPNCPPGQGIFEVYDVESRNKIINNNEIKQAELVIALSTLQKDQEALQTVANILGCIGKGPQVQFSHIRSFALQNSENREEVKYLISKSSSEELNVLSVIRKAKAFGILWHESNATFCRIDDKKIQIMKSIKEESIIGRLLTEGELLNSIKGAVSARVGEDRLTNV